MGKLSPSAPLGKSRPLPEAVPRPRFAAAIEKPKLAMQTGVGARVVGKGKGRICISATNSITRPTTEPQTTDHSTLVLCVLSFTVSFDLPRPGRSRILTLCCLNPESLNATPESKNVTPRSTSTSASRKQIQCHESCCCIDVRELGESVSRSAGTHSLQEKAALFLVMAHTFFRPVCPRLQKSPRMWPNTVGLHMSPEALRFSQ